MNKEMIVSSNGHEVVASILEDDQVGEIYIEREKDRGVVGNIYKGRVNKVLPGMQSAFVDIGLERDAQNDDPDVRNTTKIRVLKNRFAGITGPCCNLKYNIDTGRLDEVQSSDF